MMNYTKHCFSNENGITGNLAADPEFKTDKDGGEYATFSIYCSPLKAKQNDDDKKDDNRNQKSDKRDISLIAKVFIYKTALFEKVEHLKKGDFVNFVYKSITISQSEDEETGEVKPSTVSFNATDFTVRSESRKRRVESQPKKSDNHENSRRNTNYPSRKK
ncbi:MAG: single-stranded DNA-binding protein [Gammaproteobacteria bacterium]|nr:single-stranded DNA-binding protein [Gammaproteobacteria bacterium]MBY0544820.1 single-stranded DNA-binding protein [Gammaproteobacteria bacterium]